MDEISIKTPFIGLDQFLKWAGITDTGGQTKILLAEQRIILNGKKVIEKRKKIFPGDILEIKNIGKWQIISEKE